MGVLHLLGTAGDGGAETYFVDLLGALSRAGVSQAAAIRRHAGREAALKRLGVPTRTLPFGGPIDFVTKLAAAGYAQTQGTKLALAWMNRAARHTPKGPWARIGRLGGYYNLKYYAGFDELVANTEDIAEWIVNQGWPAGRVRCIPNFAAAPGETAPVARAGLSTPEDAPLLLAMGRLHEAKAHDVALQALALTPQAWLWIAGAGPEEARLKAMAVALGVDRRVRFLGWRNDASALYRTADICVFPSRYEPLGNFQVLTYLQTLRLNSHRQSTTGPTLVAFTHETQTRSIRAAETLFPNFDHPRRKCTRSCTSASASFWPHFKQRDVFAESLVL